jgi:hypothetical protein
MPAAPFTATFLYLTGGLTIWALRFAAAYAFTAIVCARGWDAPDGALGVAPVGVALMSAAALAGCAAIAAHAVRRLRSAPAAPSEEARRFVHYVAATVALLGALAIAWETLPALVVPACR